MPAYTAAMPALVLHPRYLLPIAPEDAVLEGTSVAVEGGRIVCVAPRREVEARYPGAGAVALDTHILMPGLVNAHGHLAMSLMRGLSESQPLDAWLEETIWPLEARCVSPEFVADGTALALAEMIATGTTCASDMYWFPEAAARTRRRGRGSGCRWPSRWPSSRAPGRARRRSACTRGSRCTTVIAATS